MKAGKKNEKKRAGCLSRITKGWGIQQRDRFARLHYPRCSETFFRKVITIVKLAPTASSRTIAIQKLNNIMIMRLRNLHASFLSDKWRHDKSQNWDVLGQNFESFSTDPIADETLFALRLHISATGYLEDGAPRFTDVTDADDLSLINAGLDRRPAQEVVEDDRGQVVVTDSEKEVVRNLTL